MPQYSIAEFHGAVTHFPVAMLIAAVAFDIGAPLFKKPEWRVVSFWLLVVAVVGSVPSLISGWITGNQMFGQVDNPPMIFVRHRLAAFITSGLALILLLWRVSTKDKLKGPALGMSIVLSLVIGAMVSGTGYLGGLMTMGGGDTATSSAAPATSTTSTPAVALDPALVEKGKAAYAKNGCANCHVINGAGTAAGPNLSHEGTKRPDVDWQVAHLQNPAKMHAGSFMPSYGKLSADELKALAEYVVSNK